MTDNSAKKFIIITLLYPLPFVVALFGLLYIYDPMQIFHKPYFREARFFTDMRKQALGIIKYGEFDSYIIGTSMLETTSAMEASDKLNGKFINISVLDSYPNESAVIINYILQHATHQPKHIIYSFDPFYNVKAVKRDTSHFDFLYDNNLLNDIKFYFNHKTIECAISFSNKSECIGEYDNIYNITSWYNQNKHRFGGFENWIKYKDDDRVKSILQSIKELKFSNLKKPDKIDIARQQKYIQTYLIDFLQKYPNTKFSIIIPPYLRLFYIVENSFVEDNSMYFYQWTSLLKWFIEETDKLPNVTIYGFDNLDYADNIANYNDLSHYKTDMNSMQLDAIKDGTNILTLQNIDDYISTMEQKIKSYDMQPFVEMLKNAQIKADKK